MHRTIGVTKFRHDFGMGNLSVVTRTFDGADRVTAITTLILMVIVTAASIVGSPKTIAQTTRGAIRDTAGIIARDVARIAIPVTVRVDNLLSLKDGGSGVIIARNGNTYTVLTVYHAVQNPNADYSIYTSDGRAYPATLIQSLQPTEHDPDLALVTFNSTRAYAIAVLGDSDRLAIGSSIYVSGYPQSVEDPNHRSHEFTSGQVTSRPIQRPQGYTIRHDALTRRGMSGAPMFNSSGQVVAIHGLGDRDSVVVSEPLLGSSTTEIKTGFGAAIPINTILRVAAQLGFDRSFAIAIKQRPTSSTGDVPQPTEQNPSDRGTKQPWSPLCRLCSN